MAVVSITGAEFTVEVASVAYTDQVTSGTITTTPTITRTKTLGGVAFNQTDLNSTVNLSFLYDDNSGLYDALQTSITAGTSIALEVVGDTGTWTGAAVWIDSCETSFEAAGMATCTVSFTGPLTFA